MRSKCAVRSALVSSYPQGDAFVLVCNLFFILVYTRLETQQKQLDESYSCYIFTVMLLQIYGYGATDLRVFATDLRRHPQPPGKVLQICGRGAMRPFLLQIYSQTLVVRVATDLQSGALPRLVAIDLRSVPTPI